MSLLQNGGSAPAAAADVVDRHHHPDLHEGRDRGIAPPAGAGRFLGAMVRTLQAAHADPGKSRPRRQGQGEACQDGYRQASGNSRPDGHPVDPGRDRLRERPARRRLHGRAAGRPGDGLPRAPAEGSHRRRGKGSAESRGRGARRRTTSPAPPIFMRSSWRKTIPTSPRSPVSRAAMSAPARSNRRRKRSNSFPKPSAATRPLPRRKPRSISPNRRSRSARFPISKPRSRPIRPTIRRASILPWRSTPPANAKRPSII